MARSDENDLIRLLGDTSASPDERMLAAAVLGKQRNARVPIVIRALLDGMSSDNNPLAYVCMDVLVRMGERVKPTLQDELQGSAEPRRVALAEALRRIDYKAQTGLWDTSYLKLGEANDPSGEPDWH